MANRTAVVLALVFVTATGLAAQSTPGETTASATPKGKAKIVPTKEAHMKRVTGIGGIFLEKTDDSEYGKFGWVVDPEGNKVELWQPPEGQ